MKKKLLLVFVVSIIGTNQFVSGRNSAYKLDSFHSLQSSTQDGPDGPPAAPINEYIPLLDKSTLVVNHSNARLFREMVLMADNRAAWG